MYNAYFLGVGRGWGGEEKLSLLPAEFALREIKDNIVRGV